MLEGTFEKAPTIGINEVWISTETGQPVKEIIKRVVRLGNDETEAQVISEADEIVYDDLSPDSNLHQVRPIEVSAKPKPIKFYSSRNRGHKI
ncbi:MAG: hypothetical protein LCH37_14850 [Bacteroidetes bacterium]|nr:hypothetical protein [Bacteroidota bacterium]